MDAGLLEDQDKIPAPLEKIYDQSVPKFKTQAHFYGYDGRGGDPTRFDCVYTYNLGMTVFSLIANWCHRPDGRDFKFGTGFQVLATHWYPHCTAHAS